MVKYNIAGLTDVEVEKSREKHGGNELPPPQGETFWDKLVDNFNDPLIKILCVALAITVILGFLGYAEWFEGFGIAFAVFLATFVATYSEYKNESSFQELQEQASKIKCNVFRNGEIKNLLVGEIVVGDYILLQAGDKVPADGPVAAGSLGVSLASINGEPEVVRKWPHEREGAHYNPDPRDLLDAHLVFRGAIVEEGEGVMCVDSVGKNTVYGQLIKEIDESEDRDSPLTVKLGSLADGIANIGYIGAVFIFLSFIFKQFIMDQGYDLSKTLEYIQQWQLALHDTVTALILSIIIIVVAVPEGLPMMIAIVLALNMSKLLERKVLVRRLLGIETAGSLNVLFTDKTGTITHGHLETHQFLTGDLKNYDFVNKDKIPEKLEKILDFCLKHSTASHIDSKGKIVGGNSSDRAFLEIVDRDYLRKDEEVESIKEILFTSITKYSASQLEAKESVTSLYPNLFKGSRVSIVKGAPEKILPFCNQFFTSTGDLQNLINEKELSHQIDNLSHSGIRVIALATSFEDLNTDTKEIPSKLNLVGFIGLRDEIRKESKLALQMCRTAGIQVVMITGDRKETAISIAREVGLLPATSSPEDEGSDRHLPRNSVLTHDDIKSMNDEELSAIMPEIRVIARALPTDKSRLVTICQKLNKVVGMTGDGVNDTAALKKADVGFAMGSGTEMAKEAADIVIMDDNFHSISTAILFGRTIFKSIRKFITFQSTINVASTLIVFLGPFLGFDFPLTLIQLLWVNLVMDTLAALAFGGEPALPAYMEEKPIRRDEAIVSPYMWSSIIINGVFIATLSTLFLTSDSIPPQLTRNGVQSIDVFLTAFFNFYIFITTLNAFNVRTRSANIFEGIGGNSGFLIVLFIIFVVQISFTYIGGSVLRTVPLDVEEWFYIIKASLIIIPWDIVRKLVIAPWLPKRLLDPVEGKEEQKKKND